MLDSQRYSFHHYLINNIREKQEYLELLWTVPLNPDVLSILAILLFVLLFIKIILEN